MLLVLPSSLGPVYHGQTAAAEVDERGFDRSRTLNRVFIWPRYSGHHEPSSYTSHSLTEARRGLMDALRLFFEGLLALSTLSFFVCAYLADGSEKGTLPGRSTTTVSTVQFNEAMQPRTLHHF